MRPTGTHIQRFEHAPLSGADLGYFSFFLNKKEKVSPPTVESHAPPDPPDPQRPYRVERCAKQVFRAHLYRSGRKTRMALKMAFFIAALSCKISGIPFLHLAQRPASTVLPRTKASTVSDDVVYAYYGNYDVPLPHSQKMCSFYGPTVSEHSQLPWCSG